MVHCILVLFLFFYSKIIFDQNLFPFCWDELDYPGSIVYLSCYSIIYSGVYIMRLQLKNSIVRIFQPSFSWFHFAKFMYNDNLQFTKHFDRDCSYWDIYSANIVRAGQRAFVYWTPGVCPWSLTISETAY